MADSNSIAPQIEDGGTNVDRSDIICVTGASGFVGSHVVKALLEKGYSVRATVRDASNDADVAWIKALAENTPGRVQIFSADLNIPGSFDEAVDSADIVIHTAAVVKMSAKNPKEEIVNPSLEGTRSVFSSILKSRTAKKVIHTSSVSAVLDYLVAEGHVFTEEDWNRELSLKDPYGMAKTLSEKYAWKVYKDQPEDATWRFELVVLNPALVLGPLLHKKHASASPAVVKSFLDGTMPLALDFAWSIVHVADVASAYVAAVERPEVKGRFILCNGPPPKYAEIAGILRQEFPNNNNIPKSTMPHWLTHIVAFFHPGLDANFIKKNLGKAPVFSGQKAGNELNLAYKNTWVAVADTGRSLVEFGVAGELGFPERPGKKTFL